MIRSVVSKRYAKALFEVASEHGALEQVKHDLERVAATFSASADLVEWLAHPATQAEHKKEVFARIFEGLNPYTLNLLFLLADRRRESEIPGIAAEFNRLVDEKNGVTEALVTTAFPLKDEERNMLVQMFETIVGKKIRLTEKVDSDILGGVVVQVGDRLYDGSLRTKLVRFQEQLKGNRAG
ncbi:F0F1 ATP synthase subunit delta [Staphylospora marina]|uniref:F0F1 ATP synthase subunit delta n=1 Tax=Staphylospora marina TaxID=2490858 RepID=UPI000F5BA37C|nr:F0F1 ATP synthase subunit delta [Staphylospora marina]